MMSWIRERMINLNRDMPGKVTEHTNELKEHKYRDPHGLARTSCMCTTTSTRQWQPWKQGFVHESQ